MASRSIPTPQELERIEKRRRAVQLRTERHSYAEIAKELKITIETARSWISRELITALPREEVEELRALEAATLDRLEQNAFSVLNRLMMEADQKKVIVIDEEGVQEGMYEVPTEFVKIQNHIIEIQKRRARLFGLDAPVKMLHAVAIRNEYDAEIEEVVMQLVGGGTLVTQPHELDAGVESQDG